MSGNTTKWWSLTTFSVFVCCVALVIFVVKPDFSKTPVNSLQLKTAEFAGGDYANPIDISESAWEPVQLTDRVPTIFEQRNLWLRMDVSTVPVPDEPLAVYIPTVRQNVVAFLNNTWIGQGGETAPYGARLWQHPQIFEFSPDLIDSGNTTLYLNLLSQRKNNAFVSSIYVGPASDLLPVWEWRQFLKIELLHAINYLLLIVGAFNLAIWILRRKDSFYGWYALAAFAWGVRGLILVNPEIEISERTWIILRSLTLGYGVVFIAIFNQRFFGWKHKAFDWAMLFYCIPACLPFLFLDLNSLQFYAHEVWARIQIYLGLGVMLHLIWLYVKHNQIRALLLVTSGVPLFLLGFRDFLVLTDRWDPGNGFLINYATPPALILALWFILQRFVGSLSEVERLNIGLQEQIAVKEQEIKAYYEKHEEMRKKQLLNEERQRITRDLHDGVAGYLIGLKSYVEREDIAPAKVKDYVDRSLSDLRFVINSMNIGSQSISSILALLRKRWQIIATESNVNLIWRVTSDNTSDTLGIRKSLQIHRILEEAFSNSIRHSGSKNITISSQSTVNDDGDFGHRVVLKDDGAGTLDAREGHGLKNMQFRADRIGVNLEINALEEGCEVVLELM